MAEIIDTGSEMDQWGDGEGRESAHRGCIAPRGSAAAYGCTDEAARICESAVCGNEGMVRAKRTALGLRRGGHVGPVVSSLIPSSLLLPLPCSAPCRERMRQPGGWSARPLSRYRRINGGESLNTVTWTLQVCWAWRSSQRHPDT